MSHLRVLSAVDNVVRTVADRAARAVGSFRAQVPGARMIGEFAVRTGVDQLRRRMARGSGGRTDGPESSEG